MRSALVEAVGEEKLRAIACKLASMAAEGDVQAAALLFSYILGKPQAAPNPDTLDLEEWRLFDAQPTVAEILRMLLDNVSFNSALEAAQMHMMESFSERVKLDKRSFPTHEVMALLDKRSSQKRKPSAPLGG